MPEYCPQCEAEAHEKWRLLSTNSITGPAPDYSDCGTAVLKTGRFGEFIGCSKFPKCKWSSATRETLKAREEYKGLRNAFWDIPQF